MKISLLKGIFLLCVMLTGMWGARQIAEGALIKRYYEEDEEGRRRGGGKAVYGISDERKTYAMGSQNFTVGSWTQANTNSSDDLAHTIFVAPQSYLTGPSYQFFEREEEQGG